MVVYYAGMGVPAGEVDTTNLDSLTVGAVPVMKALLALGVLLAIAWVVSGWYLELMGVVLTVLGAVGRRQPSTGHPRDRPDPGTAGRRRCRRTRARWRPR